MATTVFYTKCRPQQCDAWPIAESAQRVFVGYPVEVTSGSAARWREEGCREVFRDLADTHWDHSWTDGLRRGYKAQVTVNRNLVARLDTNSIVLVPRPSDGVVYAARLSGPFELVDQPEWADTYFALRRRLKLNMAEEGDHIGDVCQSWPVRSWKSLPFFAIPRWISYRLLSRNTVGEIYDLENEGLSAWETLSKIIDDPSAYGPAVHSNIEQALLNWISPATFEHLVVSLLQLEADTGIYWHHVGGSGDGGVDGIAVDSSGHRRGVLQCKWSYSGAPEELFESFTGSPESMVVATLLGGERAAPQLPSGRLLWDRQEIARLVEKHRTRLPIAKSLGL